MGRLQVETTLGEPAEEHPVMSLEQALDELLTSAWIEENPTEPLKQYARADVLAELQRRYEMSDDITLQGNAFDICAYVIGKEAGPWIRQVAEEPVSNLIALSFFRALANCIGEEAFELATGKLNREFPNQVALTAHALLAFESKQRILEWMESYVRERNPPIVKDWGQLAAIAGVSWARITEWLDQGGLLGLIALDAMHCCFDHDVGGAWLQRMEPVLLEPADSELMAERLKTYADANPTPRVTRTVKLLLGYLQA